MPLCSQQFSYINQSEHFTERRKQEIKRQLDGVQANNHLITDIFLIKTAELNAEVEPNVQIPHKFKTAVKKKEMENESEYIFYEEP